MAEYFLVEYIQIIEDTSPWYCAIDRRRSTERQWPEQRRDLSGPYHHGCGPGPHGPPDGPKPGLGGGGGPSAGTVGGPGGGGRPVGGPGGGPSGGNLIGAGGGGGDPPGPQSSH